jgi:hypothetical protein
MSGESLAARLPVLMPRVIEWATRESQRILQSGGLLSLQGIRIARAVGVAQPERIRVLEVLAIPSPDDPEIKALALNEKLIRPESRGLTLSYGIFIRQGQLDLGLLSHECRHVHQVEVAGGLGTFLPIYLKQIAEFTYDHAPYELDACEHELAALPAS